MKRNIVVCCDRMLVALNQHDFGVSAVSLSVSALSDPAWLMPLVKCPWCGKALPFPCEEEKLRG